MIHIYYEPRARCWLDGWMEGWMVQSFPAVRPFCTASSCMVVVVGVGAQMEERFACKQKRKMRCVAIRSRHSASVRATAAIPRSTLRAFASVHSLTTVLLSTQVGRQVALYEYTTQRAVVSWCSQNHRTCCSPPPKPHGRASGAWVAC
jgi:hypothetical protein